MITRQPIPNKTIVAFTDGSACTKNKLGGIGVYLMFGGEEAFISRGFSNTKTGRMEIRAGIECLRFIKDKTFRVVIYSDSQYFVNSLTKGWVFTWEKDGLCLRTNGDLWTDFLQEYRKFPHGNVRLNWVKGHEDNQGNIVADMLASYKQFTEYEPDVNPYEDDITQKLIEVGLRDLKNKYKQTVK